MCDMFLNPIVWVCGGLVVVLTFDAVQCVGVGVGVGQAGLMGFCWKPERFDLGLGLGDY